MVRYQKAQYLIRFDDLCPTMNWQIWSEIESVLNEWSICPILAVVPDIRDPELMLSPPVADFWDRVRAWQSRGWSIGLHGYQHLYVNSVPGILGITKHSEFAQLPREMQRHKLAAGLSIFSREGVRPDCWIAPAHSFDWTTVDLLAELGVAVISDGPWLLPHTDTRGITWVPQQLWRLREMPSGLWTVCYHHNEWDDELLAEFRQGMERFSSSIINLPQAVDLWRGRQLSWHDRFIPYASARIKCIKMREHLLQLVRQHG